MNEGKSKGILHAFDWDGRGIPWETFANDDLDAAKVVRRVESVFWSQEFGAESRESERLKVPFLRELLCSLSEQSQFACVSHGKKWVITKAATKELRPFRLAMET